MRTRCVGRALMATMLLPLLSVAASVEAGSGAAIMDRYATVNGVKLHYLVAGKGAPVILLHGYAQNSHMWRPLMKELAKTHLVVAPDLRGFGDSAKPESGYDKKTMAQDVHALAQSLGIQKAGVAGHDIGLMVAYAYAAQYPSEVDRLALMDAFIPGIGDTTNLFLLKDLWHFHFYGPTPLALVKGRERIYFEHFWNDFAADGTKSVSEADRRFYAQKYAQPGAMKAGMEVFRNFDQDAKDNAVLRGDEAHHAGAGARWREVGRRLPDHPGQDGRDQCRGRARDRLGTLADRRGAGAGDS